MPSYTLVVDWDNNLGSKLTSDSNQAHQFCNCLHPVNLGFHDEVLTCIIAPTQRLPIKTVNQGSSTWFPSKIMHAQNDLEHNIKLFMQNSRVNYYIKPFPFVYFIGEWQYLNTCILNTIKTLEYYVQALQDCNPRHNKLLMWLCVRRSPSSF